MNKTRGERARETMPAEQDVEAMLAELAAAARQRLLERGLTAAGIAAAGAALRARERASQRQTRYWWEKWLCAR